MCGKAMISCEIGTGTSFINTHYETGFVVPPKQPKALANAMNQLTDDNDLSNKMGTQARLRYEKNFSGKVLRLNGSSIFIVEYR